MFSLQAKATATSKRHYRGVRRKSEGRFFAVINDPSKGRRRWLGTFSSDIEAACAYDRAAIAIKGSKAKTNFPLSGYQIPNPVEKIAAYKNPEPPKEVQKINSNMIAKAATRPILPKPSIWATFPSELRRQQQLAALKMSNRSRYNDTEGCKVSYSSCNGSDPSSSAVKECRDSPTMGVLDCRASPTMGVLDLNLPAPDGQDECDHSRKTLWLFK